MTIPLNQATDARIALLQANGYRVTGCCIDGQFMIVARKVIRVC